METFKFVVILNQNATECCTRARPLDSLKFATTTSVFEVNVILFETSFFVLLFEHLAKDTDVLLKFVNAIVFVLKF